MGKIFRIIISIIMILGMFIVDEYIDFLNNTDALTVCLYLLFAIAISLNSKYSLVIYIFFLVRVLLIREHVATGINTDLYLKKWLKIIFTNKIVFLNIVGNLIIFMPLTIYIRKYKSLLLTLSLTFVIIVCFEALQFRLRVGVLDINDVILNYSGALLAIVAYEIYGALYERQKKKARRNA